MEAESKEHSSNIHKEHLEEEEVGREGGEKWKTKSCCTDFMWPTNPGSWYMALYRKELSISGIKE